MLVVEGVHVHMTFGMKRSHFPIALYVIYVSYIYVYIFIYISFSSWGVLGGWVNDVMNLQQ